MKNYDTRPLIVQSYLEFRHDMPLRNGDFKPFTYPSGTYGAAILLLFLLIPPSSRFHSRFTRYLTFALVLYWHTWLIRNCKGAGPATSFVVGIIAGWGTLWAAVLLVFTDAKVDFKRVAQKKIIRNEPVIKTARNRTSQSPHSIPAINYVWEPYPGPLKDRLNWVLDLACNFRGAGWNWRVAGIPPLPADISAMLISTSGIPIEITGQKISRTGLRRFDTVQSLILHNIWLFVKGYVALDMVMTIISHDLWFCGGTRVIPPAYWPAFIRYSTIITRAYRLTTAMCLVWMGLHTIFSLGPLFFVGVLGPRYLGTNGEPWIYPDQFGNYSNVLNRGLVGWWGAWWHQMFRFAFEAAGKWLCGVIGLEQKSTSAKLLQLLTAFFLSGCIHACGSVTQLGHTNPLAGPFLFFMLQPIGIIIEMQWRAFLKRSGAGARIPRRWGQAANFIYAHAWLFATGPLLVQDFADGGLFLFEPVMFSPLRALFGAETDRNFYRWGGRVATWHRDSNIALTGIAF